MAPAPRGFARESWRPAALPTPPAATAALAAQCLSPAQGPSWSILAAPADTLQPAGFERVPTDEQEVSWSLARRPSDVFSPVSVSLSCRFAWSLRRARRETAEFSLPASALRSNS